MEEQRVRAVIDEHWAASAAGDQVAEHEIYHDDTVCEYPQSGEIIHGRRNLQALRSHHPGKPSGFAVRRIVGEGNLWVTEYVITYEGKRTYTVSIMEFRDGKVSHEPQYFADRFDAPAWRALSGSSGRSDRRHLTTTCSRLENLRPSCQATARLSSSPKRGCPSHVAPMFPAKKRCRRYVKRATGALLQTPKIRVFTSSSPRLG